MSRHINSTRLIRTYNASTVLQTLYKHGSCSRTQLARLTGMSPATITRITAELMDQGIVQEGRMGRSTGGRKPVFIHIDHSKLYIVSLKLLRDDCLVALLDLKGTILQKGHLPWESRPPEEFLGQAVEALNRLIEMEGVNREHIIGVGVAVSGICHPQAGTLIRSVNLGWENVPIADLLGNELQLPIFIENDANACALAELWLGTAREANNFMYLKTEEGAGAGIVSNKQLLTGPRFTAGEIGHIPLIPDGELCRCGQRGCLEPYVYFRDVQARLQRRTGKNVSREEFIQLVQARDDPALTIVRETASALALGCAHWGILLDLDLITIGGFWGEFKEDIVDYCQNYYRSIVEQSGIPCSAIITGSPFSEDADLLGAAGLVIDHWFDPLSAPFAR